MATKFYSLNFTLAIYYYCRYYHKNILYINSFENPTYSFSLLSNMILLLFSPFEYQMIFRSKLCNRLDDIV